MSFDPISAGLNIAGKVIDRVWPDPAQKAEAMRKLEELRQKGELAFLEADVELLTGQLEINKMEAQHGGFFKGGWRPFVGWVCGFALAYKFLVQPFLIFFVQTIAFYSGGMEKLFPVEFLPDLAWEELSVILMGMLGIGGFRTYEKRKTEDAMKKR